MKLFITLTRKCLAVILASVIIVLILLGQLFTIKSSGIDGTTNARRVEYLESLGYNINDSTVKSKKILIPQEFSDVYDRYNALQKRAGFDLSKHKGEEASVYTYCLDEDEETVVNVIVSDGCVIGGDVSSVRIDGEMKPLMSVK